MFGHAPDGEQQVRAAHARFAVLAVDADRRPPVPCAATLRHSAFEPHVDALGLEDLLHRLRDVLVLARDQARRHLDDGDRAAEAAEHLPELEADVAAADHDQVLRHEVDVHHRLLVR